MDTREKLSTMPRLTLPHYGGKGHYMKCSEQFGCSGECADCEELDKLVERLAFYEDLIENGVTVQKWIPVTERLPDEMGKYVCRYVFGEEEGYPFEQVLWYYTNLEKPHFQHEGSMGLRVTHWMPLPEPPKE